MRSFHTRGEVGEELRDFSVVLSLVNHLPQPADVEPPPLEALYHVFKMIHCPVRTLFGALGVESPSGNPAIAGLGAPIAPSPGRRVGLVVPASIALLLGVAGTDLDRPSADGCAQGGKGMAGSVAVGEVDEAVAGVSPTDGVYGYMDLFKMVEAIGGEQFLNVVGFGRIREVT